MEDRTGQPEDATAQSLNECSSLRWAGRGASRAGRGMLSLVVLSDSQEERSKGSWRDGLAAGEHSKID